MQYNDFIVYDRTQHCYGGYWNYPLSVDGHIFRSEDVFDWMDEICYLESLKGWKSNPSQLEASLQRFLCETGQLQAMSSRSCVVNSPNNRVSDTFEVPKGLTYKQDADELLGLYNQGKRVNLDILAQKIVAQDGIRIPHTELDLAGALE